ncbi:MAG: hypothetical protein IH609_13725 [Dehalococcoidia bacterium]|nr:hypothetical protein [Dehalococcoidia bacterium]
MKTSFWILATFLIDLSRQRLSRTATVALLSVLVGLVAAVQAGCGDDDATSAPQPTPSTPLTTISSPATLPGYTEQTAPSSGSDSIDAIVQAVFDADAAELSSRTRLKATSALTVMRCTEEMVPAQQVPALWQEFAKDTILLYAAYPRSPAETGIVFVNEVKVIAVRLDIIDDEIVRAALSCDRDPLFELEEARRKYFDDPSSFLIPPPR